MRPIEGEQLSGLLFCAPLAAVGLCVNHHLLQEGQERHSSVGRIMSHGDSV